MSIKDTIIEGMLAADLDRDPSTPTPRTLADWLSALGAQEAEMGLCYRIEIDSFRWILLSKTCEPESENPWCEMPTSLDDDGLATVWIAGNHDEPIVTMRGTVGDLLPLIGSTTQVPFFFDEDVL